MNFTLPLALPVRIAVAWESAGRRMASLPMTCLRGLSLRRRGVAALVCVLIAAGACSGVWAALRGGFPVGAESAPQLTSLTLMVPQGALLTIEAKDFSGLLKRWNDSPEQAAWLKSDNYNVFSNSRLFGRLGGAQDEFAEAAGLPPDADFLNEVAGRESVFAWYDIGKLEFLYITRMSAGTAEKTSLLQLRSKFSTRKVGAQTFYVRTHGDPEKGEEQRTVAFATNNGWLLLATREDLMAGALTLMADAATTDSKTADGGARNSIATEPWFAEAHGAAAKTPGDLRMTLNLEKIVPTPYFRSYWVQQNVTQMKQYRGALTDLYLEHDVFREERVLLPKTVADTDGTAPDLAGLTELLPRRVGVFRAQAVPAVEEAVDALNSKLLQRATKGYVDTRVAPVADLSVTEVGSASDLETRIDAALLEHPAKGAELASLRQVLSAAGLQGMMTVSRTGEAPNDMWVPFQAAVVLSSAKDWDVAALEAALKQALGARLTSGGLGLQWKAVATGDASYFEISDVRPLVLAVRGKVCVLTDDAGLMQEMLAGGKRTEAAPVDAQATMIAEVDLAQERSGFARWTKLVDAGLASSGKAASTDAAQPDDSAHEPAFFSENIRSLSDAFAALEKERMVEKRDGNHVRQVVTYTWRR
jgi:hypothetical protein